MPKKKETTAVKKHGEELPSQYPDEEQGITKDPTVEEEAQEMDAGERDEDVYSKTGREKLEEDDEIDPKEEAFIEGYEEKGKMAKCAMCLKPLDEDSTIEREIDGQLLWFDSDKCVKEFLKKQKKK